MEGPTATRARLSLEHGTYGICRVCGDDIDADTLLDRPLQQLCPPCATELKTRQQAQRLGVCGLRPKG